MMSRHLRFLSVFCAAAVGCSLQWPGPQPQDGEGGAPSGANGDGPGWSLPGPDGSTSSGSSASSGPTGGGDDPLAACSWGEPTTVELAIPDWRTAVSAPLARALTKAKKLPDPGRMRAADFLNHYRVAYPPPAVDGDIGFYAGVLPGDLAKQLVLQVAVQAPVSYARPPIALAVVVDTSLSMAGEPWERAKAAVAALAGAIKPGDSFTLVTAKRAPKSASDAAEAAAIAGAIELDAGEDLPGALDDAYQAVSGAEAGRVVLVTDGAAQATSIHLDAVAENFALGVPLIGVGVGDASSYQPYFLEAATANGGGANLYLDSPDAADTLLRERFDELMITVASDVDVVVKLPESLRVQRAPLPDEGGSSDTFVTPTLNAGRTIVLRSVLETCEATYAPALALPITISLSYRPAGMPKAVPGPEIKAVIGDLKHATEPQMLKAGAIAAYADALANARAPLLQHAGGLISAALADASLVADADLLEIQSLIQADLEIIKAGN
jgi:Ca-activated chloride channel family protein